MKCKSLGVDYGTSIKTEDTCTFFHETGETIIFIHPKVAAPVYHVHGYNSESQSVYQSFYNINHCIISTTVEFKIPKKSINPYFIAELTERV